MHRRTLQAREDDKAAKAAYKHKEELIKKAKAAYAQKLVAKQSDSGGKYIESCLDSEESLRCGPTIPQTVDWIRPGHN